MLLTPQPASAIRASSAGVGDPFTNADARGLQQLLTAIPARYASAQPSHDTQLAAVVRLLSSGVERRVQELHPALVSRDPDQATRLASELAQLDTSLRSTTQRFQPWPLTLEVRALSMRAQRQLDAILTPSITPARAYDAIESTLGEARTAASAGRERDVSFALLSAYALYANGPGKRLQGQDPSLDGEITRDLLFGGAGGPSLTGQFAHRASPVGISRLQKAVHAELGVAAQVLDEVRISHATIVVNGAIIVFREGLEAVLIIAAITASFVGARSHLRRPILIGAFAGLGATLLTWVIAQVLLHLLGDGGLRLQALTGLVAIGVLLLVTNWFFHRLYWSEWIARFNRRRRALERWDGLGFLSGQVLGFMLLGLSSVYREGLETVLFLQALQTSAGTGATALGAGIGLGATLIVGTVTFKLQRKLPFKRMLILTGVLIALVLAVMVGTTVHNMQGIGWLPTTPTAFGVSTAWSTWLGVYPTWEGLIAQAGSLAFVLGSYFAAREIQVKRPQRRARASEAIVAR